MIVTTTPTIEGTTIKEYKGIVFGEVILGTDVFKDIAAGFRDIFGGRSKSYESSLIKAREEALNELISRANQVGANAVVGAKVDVEVAGTGLMMITASGTAVLL